MDLIYIKWCDAINRNEWMVEEEAKNWARTNDWVCEDVGWIVEENDKYILLSSRRSDGMYNQLTKIPTTWVLDRVELNEALTKKEED